MHIQHRDIHLLCKRNGILRRPKVCLGDIVVKIRRIQVLIQMDGKIYAVLLTNLSQAVLVDPVRLVLGQIHVQLNKLQSQLLAQRPTVLRFRQLD